MRNVLKSLFMFFAILSMIAIVFPVSIYIGYILAIGPGVILTISPSIAFYLGVILLLDTLLEETKIPFTAFFSIVLILGCGFFLSSNFNKPIYERVHTLTSKDIALDEKVEIPDTVAIYSNDNKNEFCDNLCISLLYNHITKNVLVLKDPLLDRPVKTDIVVKEYSIEQKDVCSAENIFSNAKNINVKNRMFLGECLIQTTSSLSNAGLVFIKNIEKQGRDNTKLKGDITSIDYIELLKNNNGVFEQIFLDTKVKARPYSYPLSFGPIIDGSDGNKPFGYNYFQTSKTFNDDGKKYYSKIKKAYGPKIVKIFGPSINEPFTLSREEIRAVFRKAVESNNLKIKNEYYKWFTQKFYKTKWYMGVVPKGKRYETKPILIVEPEDIVLFIQMIQDPDYKGFQNFYHIIRQQREDNLLDLIPPLVERMMSSHSQKEKIFILRVLYNFSFESLVKHKDIILEEIDEILSTSPKEASVIKRLRTKLECLDRERKKQKGEVFN